MAQRLGDGTVAFQIEDTGTTEPLLADAAIPG